MTKRDDELIAQAMKSGIVPLPHKNDQDTFVHVVEHPEHHTCRYCDKPTRVLTVLFQRLVVRPDDLAIRDICAECLAGMAETLHAISNQRLRRG